MNKKFEKFLNHKIFKRRLWEGLSVACATLLVLTTGGYHIAMSRSGVINDALKIPGSEIERSDEEQYQYFKSGNSKVAYKYNATGTAVYWWLRSAYYNNYDYFCYVDTDGSANNHYAHYSLALLPGFAV